MQIGFIAAFAMCEITPESETNYSEKRNTMDRSDSSRSQRYVYEDMYSYQSFEYQSYTYLITHSISG